MKKVLFVCSGNTCRSPMAQACFNDLAKKRGIDAVAFSAGLYTQDGLPYAANTLEVLQDNGITVSGSSAFSIRIHGSSAESRRSKCCRFLGDAFAISVSLSNNT